MDAFGEAEGVVWSEPLRTSGGGRDAGAREDDDLFLLGLVIEVGRHCCQRPLRQRRGLDRLGDEGRLLVAHGAAEPAREPEASFVAIASTSTYCGGCCSGRPLQGRVRMQSSSANF